MLDQITDLLPARLRPFAKVAIPAVLAIVTYIVSAVASGDWTPSSVLSEALTTLILLAIVWAIPNHSATGEPANEARDAP